MNEIIATLLDRSRIIERVNRLFIATDERDWPAVKDCFAASVLFDMTSMTGGEPQQMTPDEITSMWDAGLKPLKTIHHQAGNYLVNIDGDTADAFCYGIAIHYLPVDSGQNDTGGNTRTFVGSYDFGLAREGEQWRIVSFRFNLKFIEGNLDLGS